MAVLEKEIQDKIDEKRFGANSFFKTDKEKYFQMKLEAWELYPEPKNNWNEAYSLAKDFFRIYMHQNEFESAKIWLDYMIENNNNLHLFDGDLEHNEAKYHFEIGNFEKAVEKWKICVNGSGLRYFDNEDPKYLEFYKSYK